MWINQNFLLAEDVVCEGALNIGFMSLRGSGPVFIQMTTGGQVMNTICNGKKAETCWEILQHKMIYLKTLPRNINGSEN